MHRHRPFGLVLLLALTTYRGADGQRELPKIIVGTLSRDSILDALKAECVQAQLKFEKVDRHGALFTLQAGDLPVNGRIRQVTDEITFRFEDAKPGTRIVVTQELVVGAGRSFEQRLQPKRDLNAVALQELLARVKARLEAQPPAVRDTSRPSQTPP